jgi:hypothetical protein
VGLPRHGNACAGFLHRWMYAAPAKAVPVKAAPVKASMCMYVYIYIYFMIRINVCQSSSPQGAHALIGYLLSQGTDSNALRLLQALLEKA